MQTVNLFDTVYLTLRDDSEIHLTMDNSDIPTDETNIAWRCARALLDAAGSRKGSISVSTNRSQLRQGSAAAAPMVPVYWSDSMPY